MTSDETTLTWQQRMDALTVLHIGVEVGNNVLDEVCALIGVPKPESGIQVDDEFIDEWFTEVESVWNPDEHRGHTT